MRELTRHLEDALSALTIQADRHEALSLAEAAFLAGLPVARVRGMHVAGHFVEAPDLRVDTHGDDVCDPVWTLLASAYRRFGPVPTLLERDFNIPPLAALAALALVPSLGATPPSAAGTATRPGAAATMAEQARADDTHQAGCLVCGAELVYGSADREVSCSLGLRAVLWAVREWVRGTGEDQGDPHLGPDGGGGATIVWEDNRSGVKELYFSSSSDGGTTWSPAQRRIQASTVGEERPNSVTYPTPQARFDVVRELMNDGERVTVRFARDSTSSRALVIHTVWSWLRASMSPCYSRRRACTS